MSSIRNSSKLVTLALILMICAFGCKSKKKAMEASNAAAEKAKIEQEAIARKQKEEELKRREAEEKARREAEAKQNESEVKNESVPVTRLSEYFEAITNSSNVTSANNSINEALVMFASPETPVLVVISESGGLKDYDRPTTIKDYLHYLKDQKKNINKISNLKVDSSGKITEVELRKDN